MKKLKISNFTEVVTGGTPSTSQKEYWVGGRIPWLNSGELNQRFVKTSSNYITDFGLKKSAAQLMPKGTVLIALTGATTGLSALLEFEACGNQSVTGILPSDKHNSNYLLFFLEYIRDKIIDDSWGGAQKHISQAYVKNIEVPLPALSQQNAIAKDLEIADDLRQKRKEQLALLDDYLKSVFLGMFGDPEINDKGWEIQEFDYFAIIDTKMTTDFKKYSEYPHIGISNIEKGTGILFDYKLVKEENLISGKYIFTPEHIIYSKIRPNLNKVALPDFHGLSSADSYPILVKKGHANRIFFTFLLRSSFFIDFILKHSKRTNIPKANKEQIRAFRGIAPPIDLQNKFSQIYEQVEQTKQKMRASLDEMDNHFNALMQRYFG